MGNCWEKKFRKNTNCKFYRENRKKIVNSLDLCYRDNTIEIPSEYLEVNYLNNAIIMISQNQGLGTLFLVSADEDSIYPPQFSKSFTRMCLTIITKTDLVSKTRLKTIYENALEIGSEKIFLVSNKTKEGLKELERYMEKVYEYEIYNGR